MKLSEIVQRLDAFDDEATIIAAEPWTPSSRAEVVEPTEAELVVEIARDGMVYFLEVAIAREFKEDWPSEQREADFCERLIQYVLYSSTTDHGSKSPIWDGSYSTTKPSPSLHPSSTRSR